MSIFNTLPWDIAASVEDSDFIRSLGEDLILVKRPSIRSFLDHPFKTENFVLVLCSRGSMDGVVNMVPRTLDGPGILIFRPGQVIQFKRVSPEFQMHLVIASASFLTKLEVNFTEILPVHFLMQLWESPVIRVQRRDAEDVAAIFNLMFRLARNEDNPHREKSLLSVTRAFCYEAGYYLIRNNPDVIVPQQSPVMERLLALIRRHFREHRDVEFYAAQMSLTPGYLYKLVMAASGRSVRGWIEEYVVTEAKTMLRHGGMTIQQISIELNFPSQTFFGKYFKRVTGLSPKQYRQQAAAARSTFL